MTASMTAGVTAGKRVALVGNPNAGKSALFNALTGARQKIANYPGVTVERKAGRIELLPGTSAELIDLPGSYSFDTTSPDEEVTRKVVMGEFAGEARPDVLVVVVDASNLEQHLVFAQEVIEQGLPTVVALNMLDLAERDGLTLDPQALSTALGVPVVPTVAVRRRGLGNLVSAIASAERTAGVDPRPHITLPERRLAASNIAKAAILSETAGRRLHSGIDKILLHPWLGPPILFALLFVIFQAVFAWADPFIGMIEGAGEAANGWVVAAMPDSFLRDLLTEGVLAGVGSVIVFLPQIVILFAFILLMESTGYMARAAFVMDRMMAGVGLSGRSFIPLLSSFACAIPGIMATRSIADPKDRLTTILIAPLMTCSARLPVYAVIIAAVIPGKTVGPGIGLQGLVLFALYVAGIVGAMVVALVLRNTVTAGAASGFIMELPRYQLPRFRDLLIGLWQRAWVFLRRAGTIIFAVTVILWLLLTFPKAEIGENQLDASYAGQIASAIQPAFEPIGFNREMTLALVPAMAAREVAVASLATTYAVESDDEEETEAALRDQIAARWSLPTALAFLAWFVFCPAMPVDHRGCPTRDERLEMAGCHADLSVRAGLYFRRTDLLAGRLGWAVAGRFPHLRTINFARDSRGLGRPANSLGNRFAKESAMAGSLNKVMLIGNLGADPEVRSFQNGGKVCNLRIATSERWKDRNTGEQQERTEWHTVAIFSEGLVNVAERFLRKGSKVYIEGQLQTRKWQDQSGNDRYSTEVVLRGFNGTLTMLDGPGGQGGGGGGGQSGGWNQGGGGSGGSNQGGGSAGGGANYDDLDDDIPF